MSNNPTWQEAAEWIKQDKEEFGDHFNCYGKAVGALELMPDVVEIARSIVERLDYAYEIIGKPQDGDTTIILRRGEVDLLRRIAGMEE